MVKTIFPGFFYMAGQNIFQQLESVGINVAQNLRLYPWFAVLDFESLLLHLHGQDVESSGKTVWTRRHEPVSVSLCSNVSAHRDAVNIIQPCKKQLVTEMLAALDKM